MPSHSEPRSRRCVAVNRNGHPCRAWPLRGELLCKAHHPFERLVECRGGPLDGVVVLALCLGPVFYALPVDGGRYPAGIVYADMRPFPWHRVSGAYVLKVVRAEDNAPVLSYAWLEAAALAPGVLVDSPGGGGSERTS